MLGSRERSQIGRGGDKGRKMKRRMTNAHCIQPGRQERKMAGMEKKSCLYKQNFTEDNINNFKT